MATFVLMTKLAPELQRQMKDRQEMGKQFLATVSRKCPGVKWIAHYALLGPYDFMDIYEATDEEEAAKVSMISQSLGASRAESWTALPYSRFLDLVGEI
jgi:uncharacterized protein with GYD domain